MTEKEKLNNEEISRYSRQIIMPSVGMAGQQKLKSAKVLVVGAGGLGCPVSTYLAGAGIGTIGIVDYDDIEITNLHRQFIHEENAFSSEDDRSKARSIENFIRKRNSNVNVICHVTLINSTNAMDIIKQYDITVDCTDNVATRYLLNDACVILKKPLVSGSALQLEGQLTVYGFQNGPCYRCIFPKPPPSNTVQNCGDSGVLGAVTGVIGSLQSMEVIKIVLNQEHVMAGKLLLYDAAMCSFRTIKLRLRKEDCEVCGDNPSIVKLIDYEQFCGMAAEDKDPKLKILDINERITAQEYYNLKERNEDHLLIDVRSVNEFEMCKIDNSINVPIKNIQNNKIDADLLNVLQNKKIFVVCRRGNDSQIAVKCLVDEFGIKAKDVIGGLYEWHKIDESIPIY